MFRGDHSYIPTLNTLAKRYKDHVSRDELKAIHDEMMTLRFTMTSANSKDGSHLTAQEYLSISPAHANQWLSIELDISEMHFFTGKAWKQDPQKLEDHLDKPVAFLKIVNETQGTEKNPARKQDVIRNLLSRKGTANSEKAWEKLGLPETFRELEVIIAQVEFIQ